MKIWSLETLVRQLDAWTRDTYGESVLDGTSGVIDKPLGQVIEEFKQHDFAKRLIVQVPGQTKIKADPAGNVEIVAAEAEDDAEPEWGYAEPVTDPSDIRG